MTATDFDVNSVAALLESTTTESGLRFMDIATASPVLLVFLRHAGCTFCRESLSDISKVRQDIEGRGIRILLVHMGDRDAMLQAVAKYGLADLDRIADSTQTLYGAFGLRRGTFRQLYGLKVWWRGLIAGLIRGHGYRNPGADFRQMPGVFYIDHGIIARRFRHRSAADRPSYDSLCS